MGEQRAIQVFVNPGHRLIQIVMYANGAPVRMGALDLSLEQAKHHRMALDHAIKVLEQQAPLIVLPGAH